MIFSLVASLHLVKRALPSPCCYTVKCHDDVSGSEVEYNNGRVDSVEPDGLWSSNEESDSNDSAGSQASFTERLGNTLWCSCTKCVPMPRAIECTCCRELPKVEECFEESGSCVTSIESFTMVCLDKDVLYTALVTMHTV